MYRFALVASSILLSCAAQEPVVQSPPPQRELTATELSELRERLCGAETSGRPRMWADEIDCGNFLLKQGAVDEAAQRWRQAFDLSKSRAEQCEAIRLITDNALAPEAALAGVSSAVLENCKERVARARHDEVLQAQRKTCLAQCDSGVSSCQASSGTNLFTLVASDCEGAWEACRASCSRD